MPPGCSTYSTTRTSGVCMTTCVFVAAVAEACSMTRSPSVSFGNMWPCLPRRGRLAVPLRPDPGFREGQHGGAHGVSGDLARHRLAGQTLAVHLDRRVLAGDKQ